MVLEEEDDEPLMLPEEDEEEKLRKKREAIMAKFKNKGATSSSAVSPPEVPLAAAAAAPESSVDGMEGLIKPEPSNAAKVATPRGSAKKGDDGEGGDDMFTDSPVRPIAEYNGNGGGGHRERVDEGTGEKNRLDYEAGFTNADNWDDAEGYFRTRPGELIISRYLVNRDIGSGVYSTVVSAMDQKIGGQEVAIKIVVCPTNQIPTTRSPCNDVLYNTTICGKDVMGCAAAAMRIAAPRHTHHILLQLLE